MGYDVVGEIDQLGDGVRELQIGDRVADMNMRGRLPPGNQLSNRFQRNTRMLPVGSITRAAPLYRRTQAERLSI
jgi:NADPH:quinone reductase-like Zn-dependent oxidoreductase